LLATYNGERFVREQIDSILAQDYEELRILARDDGSDDGTTEILKWYEKRFPDRFRILPSAFASGSAKANFLLLMKASAAEYICFSDQDDVWVPDKVSASKRAMDQLESRWGKDLPLLVFTDLRVVDDNLQTLQESYWTYEALRPKRISRPAAQLAQNVVTGCTAMLNRRLIGLALRMPEEAIMHDQWIALLACTMGKAKAIEAQTVLYRQHDRNVIGSEQRTGSLAELMKRVRKTDVRIIQWKKNQRQASSFLRLHENDLSIKNRDIFRAYLRCGTSRNFVARIRILTRYGFLRAGVLRKLADLVDQWKMKVDEDEPR
jgi:glycosyltransferase involved in cell wall biosynthesis